MLWSFRHLDLTLGSLSHYATAPASHTQALPFSPQFARKHQHTDTSVLLVYVSFVFVLRYIKNSLAGADNNAARQSHTCSNVNVMSYVSHRTVCSRHFSSQCSHCSLDDNTPTTRALTALVPFAEFRQAPSGL